jgi:hypothetical protein
MGQINDEFATISVGGSGLGCVAQPEDDANITLFARQRSPGRGFIVLIVSLALSACQEDSTDTVGLSPLVGVWRLVSWELTDSLGNVSYPFGQHPEGQIIYTKTGHMSAQLMRTDRRLDALVGENQDDLVGEVARIFVSYYGTYTVDASAGTVTHHVQGSLRPTRLGLDQVRGFEFSGNDRVILTAVRDQANPANATFSGSSRLVWERAR